MSHRLRMSGELGDWLAELSAAEPASASEVGAALVATMEADDPASLPAVGQPAADPVDPRESADRAYQRLLEALQRIRRRVADVATDRKRSADRVETAAAAGQPDEVLAQLRARLGEAERRESAAAQRSQRIQMDVDAFRTAKETAKAMYTAAEAGLRIREAVELATGAADPPAAGGDDELAQLKQSLAAAAAQLEALAGAQVQALTAQAEQTLRALDDAQRPYAATGASRPQESAGVVAGLLELRADPLGRDVRVLMAVEPAGTVTLLAVLDDEEAIAQHRTQAIELAGGLLTDIRAGHWPPDDAGAPEDTAVTFADPATFVSRFFPADTGAISERAASLAAARSLAALRSSNGMSLEDLAMQTGISVPRLHFIEDGGLRVAQVHEAVACVRALGGRLTLTAELGGKPAPVTLT